MKIKKLDTLNVNFETELKAHVGFDADSSENIIKTVSDIVERLKKEGDTALIDFTNRFDQMNISSASELEISSKELSSALDNLPGSQKKSLEIAAQRIVNYHNKQKIDSWSYDDETGSSFGQNVTPMDKVGLYVPGGKAAYPSSVLMNAIPAKVAGVKELIMVVPTPGGERNPLVLAAAKLSGVDHVFGIGGAQAVAALAYGTKTIPKVDKIVGPGNAYVAEAKRKVFGAVGIDMIAGPSEILIICDGKTNPDWIAMDLFSQAEHDELAQSILISPDQNFLSMVEKSIEKLIDKMDRKKIIETSLKGRGLFILTKDLMEAAEVSNIIAPEHLELSVEDPDELLKYIRHAGAVFMGRNTCEAVGDYCAGPNHVLPTSGTAKFSSPLGVYDFQKRSSIINLSEKSASELGLIAEELAMGEGLQAHAMSAKYRVKDE